MYACIYVRRCTNLTYHLVAMQCVCMYARIYVCTYVFMYVCTPLHSSSLFYCCSLKWQVSFAEYGLFYRALLQKRPRILRSLLIVSSLLYCCGAVYMYLCMHARMRVRTPFYHYILTFGFGADLSSKLWS